MTWQERTQRAGEAKELLDNPRLKAALDEMEQEAIGKWKYSDRDDAANREDYWRQYVAVEKFRARLAAAIEDGQMAEYEQKQKGE